MNIKKLFVTALAGLTLAACGQGAQNFFKFKPSSRC